MERERKRYFSKFEADNAMNRKQIVDKISKFWKTLIARRDKNKTKKCIMWVIRVSDKKSCYKFHCLITSMSSENINVYINAFAHQLCVSNFFWHFHATSNRLISKTLV